jgi:DNA uptake protein ComE-like DNA-binding protein
MPRVFINNCSIEELMSVPEIGAKGADNILELREAKGDLELDDLNQDNTTVTGLFGFYLF